MPKEKMQGWECQFTGNARAVAPGAGSPLGIANDASGEMVFPTYGGMVFPTGVGTTGVETIRGTQPGDSVLITTQRLTMFLHADVEMPHGATANCTANNYQ
jgi:hypothetical protein